MFEETCIVASNLASENRRVYYVFEGNIGFFVSHNYQRNWLFKAYPGGRKILSVRGREFSNASIFRVDKGH